MKNLIKIIFIITSISFFYSFQNQKKLNLNAKLLGIEYFSKSECSEKLPIMVRITYSLSNINSKEIKMIHTFPDGISITKTVTELDKKGNIIYEFCTSKDKEKSFTTVFIASDGIKSNIITVNSNPKNAKIIEGTAPQTIKLN